MKHRLITLTETLARSGLRSKNALYREVKRGAFPKPVPVTDRTTGFIEAEVDRWIEQRVERREQAWEEHPARLYCLRAGAASAEARRGPAAAEAAVEPVKR